MTSVVYVDVLIVLNLMINYSILTAAAGLSGIRLSPLRTLTGAAVGALGALTIFFPGMGPLISSFAKLSICALMVLIASKSPSLWSFLKLLFTVFAVSFIFAGTMLAVYIWIGPKGMLFYNGIVYFGIRPIFLLILTAFSYLIVEVVSRLTRRRAPPGNFCKIRVIVGGRSASVHALLDSGNFLTEPFSGLPVVVCQYRDISSVAPDYILDYLSDNHGGEARAGIRLIPFHTVSGHGALPAFRPDRAQLVLNGRMHDTCDLYMAVTLDNLGDNEYSAIANPAILGHQFEKVGEIV